MSLAFPILAAAVLVATGAHAQAPAPASVTPELIAAARQEGKVVFYTSMDIKVAQALGKGLRSFHPQVVEPADRMPLARIKAITTEPHEQEKLIDEVTRKYAEYFGT